MMKILLFLIATFPCFQAVTFNCTFATVEFGFPVGEVYACFEPIIGSVGDGEDLTAIYGTHEIGKTNTDVIGLRILSNPSMTFIPRLIGDFFSNLIIIRISNTNISSLNGDALSSIQSLTRFRMYENSKFETISGQFFSQMKNLMEITLRNNSIKEIEGGVFFESNAIATIDLSDNNLEHLNERVFTRLPSLSVIHLFNNKFERIAGHLFIGSTALVHISFNNNHIKHIGEDFLEDLQKLSSAFFNNNYCVNQDAWNSTQMLTLLEHLRNNCTDIVMTTTEVPSCGEINEVICNLEVKVETLIADNEELKASVEDLLEKNAELQNDVEILKIKNDKIIAKNEELFVKNQEMDQKLDQILEGILELSTCPCGI